MFCCLVVSGVLSLCVLVCPVFVVSGVQLCLGVRFRFVLGKVSF